MIAPISLHSAAHCASRQRAAHQPVGQPARVQHKHTNAEKNQRCTVITLDMDERRRDVSIVTIKVLCDGLEISLAEFFSGEEFADLEQEIQ